MKKWTARVGVLIVMLVTSVGSAIAATSAGGFYANTATDAPYIVHNTTQVYSSDTSGASRTVTASSGYVILNPGARNFNFYIKGNGQSFTCSVNLINVFTGAGAVSGNATTSAVGFHTLTVTVPDPGVPGGQWLYNFQCNLPAYSSVNGFGYIYGAI